jgi:P-type Ca2+ transporter type 2C
MIFLPTVLNFLQGILGVTNLTFEQWLVCFALGFALLLVDEVFKFFLRRSRSQAAAEETTPATTQTTTPIEPTQAQA